MLSFIADTLVRIIGVVLISTGPVWQVIPVRSARMFGVPTATAETAVFGPGIGGRNSAAGLMLLVLSFNGLRSMAAIWIAMWVTFAGLTDTGICLRHGNNWETHMMNVGIGWIVATLLWNS